MYLIIKKNQKGFTLVEVMVATALFVTVAVIALSAILATNRSYKKGEDMRAITDNLDFAMQEMARSLKFGYKYVIDSSGKIISFFPNKAALTPNDVESPPEQLRQAYLICDEGVRKVDANADSPLCNDGVMLTDSRIELDTDKSRFYVYNTVTGDNKQPFVTIVLTGTIYTKKGAQDEIRTPFSVQTSVAQRILDSE